jgi:hypothetical protein
MLQARFSSLALTLHTVVVPTTAAQIARLFMRLITARVKEICMMITMLTVPNCGQLRTRDRGG